MKNYNFFIFCFFLANIAFAQTTSLVKDIYTGDEGSELGEFVQIDANAYFTSYTRKYSNDKSNTLWKIEDATNKMTAIHANAYNLNVIDKVLFFSSLFLNKDGFTYRYFLYRYDSTNDKLDSIARNNGNNCFLLNQQLCYIRNNGLMKIDFAQKQENVIQTFSKNINLQSNILLNNELYFFAEDRQLWKSDGTTNGTMLLRQFKPNTNLSSNYQFNNIFAWNGNIYFVGNQSGTGQELWKSDGTVAGTVLVKDIVVGATYGIFNNFITTDNFLFFVFKDSYNNYQLWRTDGTSAETKLCYKAINKNYYINLVGAIKKSVIFSDYDASFQQIVLATDGNTVEKILPAANVDKINLLLTIKDTAYLAQTIGEKVVGIWKTNGTAAGTQPFVTPIKYLREYYRKTTSASLQDSHYFTASDDEQNYEMWRTDGSASGTYQFTDIRKGKGGAAIEHYKLWGNKIIFMADNGSSGLEPWVTDGTKQHTVLLKNVNTALTAPYISRISPIVKVNNKLCFFANDPENGTELWASDGSTQGTTMIKNFTSNSASTKFDEYKNNVFDNKLYINLKTDSLNFALWETDGTSVGTRMLVHDAQKNIFRQPLFKKGNFLYYYTYPNDNDNYNYQRLNSKISKINLKENNPAPIVVWNIPSGEECLYFGLPKKEKIVLTRSYIGNDKTIIKINIFDALDSIKTIELGNVSIPNVFVSDDNIIAFYYHNTSKSYQCFCYNITTKKSFVLDGFYLLEAIQYDNRILFFAYIGNSNQLSINEINFEKENYYTVADLENVYFSTYLGYIKNKLIYSTRGRTVGSPDKLLIFDIATLQKQVIEDKLNIEITPNQKFMLTRNLIYFYATDTLNNLQIYQTGGTKETSKVIANTSVDGVANYNYAVNAVEINGNIYYIANDGIHGYELWKYDPKYTDTSEPNQEENAIQLFPNPASTFVQIKAMEAWQNISIIDVTGRKHYHNSLNINDLQMPIENLSNGIYFIEITFSNQKRTVKKFVVQK